MQPSTINGNNAMLKKHILPYWGDRVLDEIQPTDSSEFMSRLTKLGLSEHYRLNIYGLLKLMLEVAVDNDLMSKMPLRAKVHRPKVRKKEKAHISPEQGRAILEAAEPPFKTAIATVAMTGVRLSELRGLRWRHRDFLGKRIFVREKVWKKQVGELKTEASRRDLAMPEELSHFLLKHRADSRFTGPDDFVFCQEDGTPMDPDSFRKLGITPSMEKAGVPFQKRASGAHMFRHLAGSIIHKETGSLKLAQSLLGHSNVATTGDIYTHVDRDQMNHTAEVLGKVFAGTCGRSVVETVPKESVVQ